MKRLVALIILLFVLVSTTTVALANDKKYTSDELLKIAIANSRDINRANIDIRNNEILRDHASRQYTNTPMGNGNGIEDARQRQVLQGFLAADTALSMSKRQIDTIIDNLDYRVNTAYNNLLRELRKVETREQSYLLARREVNINQIRYELGMISMFELNQSMLKYKEEEKKKLALNTDLNKAYIELNTIVGFKDSNRYEVERKEFEISKDYPELSTHLLRLNDLNPNFWMLDQNVNLAETSLDLYTFNAGLEPYASREVEVTKAVMDREIRKEQFREYVKRIYLSLEQIEDQYKVLKTNLESAQKQYDRLLLNYEIGVVTKFDLDKAKHSITELEDRLYELEIQHDNTKRLYLKPWVN